MIALPQVRVTKDDKPGRYTVSVNGMPLPNVASIQYDDVGSPFPRVTIVMIAELYTNGRPLGPVEDYAPWRDERPEEE